MLRHPRPLGALALTLVAAGLHSALSLTACSTASDAPSSSPPSTPLTPFPHVFSGPTSRLVGVNAPFSPPTLPGSTTSPSASAPPLPGWNIPTSTPVRTTSATYGAFVEESPTDFTVFAVYNYKPASITAPGIAAATAAASIGNWSSLSATQQTEAEESTVFVVTNLYSAAPMLLGWSNSSTTAGAAGNHAKDALGRAWVDITYDPTNLELFTLGLNGNLFCWEVPSPQSSAGYAASQAGALATCNAWPAGGKGTSGGSVTYSGAWLEFSGSDAYEAYWGDDTGNLNCLKTNTVAGDAGAGKAPTACSTSYTGGAYSLGTTQIMGPPIVLAQSSSEAYVFIGSQYGTMYRVDDKQAPGTPTVTTSMFCGATGTVGAACPTTTGAQYAIYGLSSAYGTASGDYVVWASNGTLYAAPAVGHGTNGAWITSDIASVPLFTPTPGAPILSGVAIDRSQSTMFAYVAANSHLYKVALPLTGPVYSSPLYRRPEAQTAQSLTLSAAETLSIPSVSWPLAPPLAWYDSLFVVSGYGNAPFSGSVGAPVSTGIVTPTVSGGLEQYGCAGTAANPFLSDVTTTTYGVIVETGLVLDSEVGNLYFGYDTGGAAPTGGFAQQPASAAPTSGWSCPAPLTLGSACGSTTACIGTPAAGKCVNDSDCSGTTPYCDIFPDSAYGTCVECRTDTNCPQTSGFEVCDTNDQLYDCVPTARCTTTAQCKNTTDDPDYATTETLCNTTPGPAFDLCATCISNATCTTSTSTPVCDVVNAGYVGFGTCVECTADTDCLANDEYANAGLVHCDQTPGSPNLDHGAACTSNAQCGSGTVCDTTAASASTTYFDTCVPCDAANAAGCATGTVCDTVLNDANYDQCVPACTPAGSTNAPANSCGLSAPVCTASGTCIQCTTNAQCPGNATNSTLVCNASSVCTCLAASDCPGGAASGATCQGGVCIP